jgi:chromosomal replication initiation ATPase DnaA
MNKSKVLSPAVLVVNIKQKMIEINALLGQLIEVRSKIDGNHELDWILDELETKHFITIQMIRSANRLKKLAAARQLFCWYARQHSFLTLKQIGEMIHRDHSTIIHSIQTCQDRLDTQDSLMLELYDSIFTTKQ